MERRKMEAAAERKPEGIKLKIGKKRGSSAKALSSAGKSRRTLPLYLSMAKIGLIGFGGGSALIPVIEREVVEDQHIVTEEDYNKVVVEACVTPGALPVEIAAGLGKRAGGIRGMLAASLLMAVPGVLLTVVILSLLSNVSAGVMRQIQCLSIGLGAFISCLLILYAVNSLQMARAAGKKRLFRAAVIMAGVFVLNSGSTLFQLLGIQAEPFFGLSAVQVLALAFFGILYTNCRFHKKNAAVAAAVSAVYVLCMGNNGLLAYAPVKYTVWAVMAVLAVRGLIRGIREDAARSGVSVQIRPKPLLLQLLAWAVFTLLLSVPGLLVTSESLPYLIRGLASSVMSFGGGDAYLTVADGLFVHTGMLSNSDFYGSLVPVANVLPGSILCKILAGVGYSIGYGASGTVVGGYSVALAGFACSVSASGGIFCIFAFLYEAFAEVSVFRQIGRWIRPIVAGLLLNVVLSVISQNFSAGLDLHMNLPAAFLITGAILGADLLLLFKFRAPNWLLILLSAGAGLLLCNLAM